MSLWGAGATVSSSHSVISPELKEKFPIKSHHAKLSLRCTDCHEGQGENPENYKMIGDEGCLSCHKTKQHLADRLKINVNLV